MNNLIGVSGRIGSGKDLVGDIIKFLYEYYYSKKHHIFNSNDNYIDFVLKSLLRNKKGHYFYSMYETKKFADSVKDIVSILTGFSRDDIENRDNKDKKLGNNFTIYKSYNEHLDFQENFVSYKEALDFCGWKKDLIKEEQPTLRDLMIYVAEDFGKKMISPDVWVNSLFRNYKSNDKWIITDVRFPNEYKAIKDEKGILIKVYRPLQFIYPDEFKLFKNKTKMGFGTYREEDEAFINYLSKENKKLFNQVMSYTENSVDNLDFDFEIINKGDERDLIREINNKLFKYGEK